MSINSLKKALIGKIVDTNDEEVLKEIDRMRNSARDVYQLSEEELAWIEEAQEQYQRGEVISHEDLEKELDKWLK